MRRTKCEGNPKAQSRKRETQAHWIMVQFGFLCLRIGFSRKAAQKGKAPSRSSIPSNMEKPHGFSMFDDLGLRQNRMAPCDCTLRFCLPSKSQNIDPAWRDRCFVGSVDRRKLCPFALLCVRRIGKRTKTKPHHHLESDPIRLRFIFRFFLDRRVGGDEPEGERQEERERGHRPGERPAVP